MLDAVAPSLPSSCRDLTGTAEHCSPTSRKAWFESPGLSKGLSIQP